MKRQVFKALAILRLLIMTVVVSINLTSLTIAQAKCGNCEIDRADGHCKYEGKDCITADGKAGNCISYQSYFAFNCVCKPKRCNTIKFNPPQFHLLHSDELRPGTVLIPGVNNNDPVPIFTFETSGQRSLNPQVKAALLGGDYPSDGPLQPPHSLIQGFVASQLSVSFASGESGSQLGGDSALANLGTMRSPLNCHGLKLSPVILSNGFEISDYSTLLELSDQTSLVFVDECRTEVERAADMRALGGIYQRLYGKSEAPELRVQITTDRGSVEKGQNPAYFVGEPIAIKFRVDGAAQALVTIEDVLPDGRTQVFFRQTVTGNQTLQLNARITPPLGRESLRLTARAGEQTAKDQCSFTVFAAGGAPCAGGELLVRHAYSECNSDGFWHAVEDAYYACPPNGQVTRFRVFDKKTEQRCGAGQAAPNPIGTLFKVADETCQAPVKVGTVVITECRNGLWDHATYTLFECLDKSRRISRTSESSVTTGVRCTDAPPPLLIPQH